MTFDSSIMGDAPSTWLVHPGSSPGSVHLNNWRTEMDEILRCYEQTQARHLDPTRIIPAEAAATLVLANVVREAASAIVESLNQFPIELKYELTRLLVEQTPFRPST
jgi:hypothetical protein